MADLLPPPLPAEKKVNVTVLLDKRTRYLVDLAAREHDCSLTKYMEQAITSYLEQDEFRNHGLWDDDPAIRMYLLVTARPDLLTEEERAMWKRIRSDASLLDSNGAVDRHKLSAAWNRLQQKGGIMPTQQETELDQLRTQVAELTEKSRTRKARITELETANTDLQTRLGTAETTLLDLQIGAPLRTLAAAVSPIPSVFMAEFSKLYKLELREGRLTVLDSKGEALQVDNKPVEFTPEAISKLVTTGDSDEAKTFAHITYGTQSSGSSAHHQHGRSQPMDSLHKPNPKEKQQPPSAQFGLR